MLDTLIRGALVIDGTGSPRFAGDVGVQNGKIVALGDLSQAEAARVLDGTGCVVAPGMIDIHTHSDLVVMRNRQHVESLCQGVTSELVGLCGLGFAPIAPQYREALYRYMVGIFGPAPAQQWESFMEFRQCLAGASVNVAAAMTHNAARIAGAGFENVPLQGHRLKNALAAVEEAMQSGAVGFSVGLSYYPGAFGGTGELIELARVAAKYDVPFLAHTRVMPPQYGVDPVREMIAVAKETGVQVHMLHYRKAPEQVEELFGQAVQDGCRFTFEYYPYLAGCGFGLVFLPPWAHEGGPDALMERLHDPKLCQKMARDVQPFVDLYAPPGVSGVFTSCGNHPEYVGLDFETVSQMRGETIAQMIVSVLRESGLDFGFRAKEPQDEETRRQEESWMRSLILRPDYTIGSDAICYGDKPHPRAYGTFARMLRKSREWNVPLETILHKLTQFNAELLRIRDRGVIREGMAADLIVFDPETVTDRATYDDPRNTAAGMRYVLVNGKLALRDERPTGELEGQSLARG